jgi:hypothetical protein
MQYGQSVLRQLGTSAEQRYDDDDMHISGVVFGQRAQVVIKSMGRDSIRQLIFHNTFVVSIPLISTTFNYCFVRIMSFGIVKPY